MRIAIGRNAVEDNRTWVAAGPRRSSTVTVIAVLMCMLAVKSFDPQRQTSQSSPQVDSVSAVRIVDPAFCQNQTWPYIDPRCLKRSDNPPIAAPTKTGTTESGQYSEPSALTPPSLAFPSQTDPNGASGSSASISERKADTSADMKAAENNAGSPNSLNMAMNDFQAQSDPPPHHSARHYRHARFLFGFRF